ncbi:hypothetical protein HII31_00136 [Pseudocercospora fuligena]|uniref:Uncharacterized protein n=1 Tax=Pseudocercospora fuligena TaxID=685502 RepID=A0A8H6RWV2_9PEZI|nr:hypothetical protein HII31_00136 [Pseudocercospora fuligena]
MKHLNAFEVIVSNYNSTRTFKLTLSTSGNLEVTGPEDDDLVKHSLQDVQKYVARIERQRKLLHLKGEAIILALTSEPDMLT